MQSVIKENTCFALKKKDNVAKKNNGILLSSTNPYLRIFKYLLLNRCDK